jgi:hypothetical protein
MFDYGDDSLISSQCYVEAVCVRCASGRAWGTSGASSLTLLLIDADYFKALNEE